MKQQETVFELDVLFLLKVLWEKKVLILGTALVTMCLSIGYHMIKVTPMYSATTRVYVEQVADDATDQFVNPDSRVETYLAKEYKEVVI